MFLLLRRSLPRPLHQLSARQAHTRQPPHLPRCPQKSFCRLSEVVDAFVVRRGLDVWVCACVRFTEQLRAPQASHIIDHLRFVLLDVFLAPRLSVQVMPVPQVVLSLGESRAHAPFHPTQSRVQLESVGPFRKSPQMISRHHAPYCERTEPSMQTSKDRFTPSPTVDICQLCSW